MNAEPLELEGTWEEIMQHAGELAGRRVKLIVLPVENIEQSNRDFSTAASLLKHAGTWEGEDFEECLQAVYDNRT